MWVPRAANVAAATLLLLAILAGSAQAQAAPDSLKFAYGTDGNGIMFLKATQLNATAQSPAAACGNMMPPQQQTGAHTLGTWSFDPTTAFPPEPAPGGNGTGPAGPKHYSVLAESWTLNVAFTSPNAAAPGTTGFTLGGMLSLGTGVRVTATPQPVAGGPNPPAKTLTFTFNATANNTEHGGGPISVTLTATPTPPAGPQGLPLHNFAVECGANSKLNNVIIYRGSKGETDLDGDRVPDGTPTMPGDSDIDNDGVSNTAEAALSARCTFKQDGVGPNFAGTPAQRPGDHDADGFTDTVECDKGSNPLSANSVPPRERTLLDILMPFILLILLLALIGGVIFAFLKFGKTVAVTVASAAELFIPPGTKGKYEVAIQNLAKKGEPRTFQLVVEGMPEGWDAKLNVDHMTLDPQGGAQNRSIAWLEVEAPSRPEPESAVITVKAVPLNKAGRKDTVKLPGKAKTITSINVPPGSKVPVKRGGKIVPAAPGEEAPAVPASVPIAQLGADEAAVKKLAAAGVENSEQLRTADAAALAKKTKLPEATLVSWQQVSDLIRLGMTPPQANGLVTGGITSIPAVAGSDAKTVAGKAGAEEKTAKSWVKAASKWVKAHPEAAPAPAGAPAATAASAAAPAAGAPKPQLQVGGLKHEPAAFRQGETVKSSVNVANNGSAQSTIKLSLYVNDGLADVQTVTVKPGKAKDVQFKWTAQEKNKLNIRGEVVPG